MAPTSWSWSTCPAARCETRLEAGPLSLDDLTRFGAVVADALHSAHERGILHRDLKPGNVVLTDAGQPKILDFGIALLLGADPNAVKLTQTGMIVGSLPYMAPEQLTDDPADARTDIYALGVLLFEMATGRRPFLKARPEALMFEIFSTAAPSLQSHPPGDPCRPRPARRRLPPQGTGAAPRVGGTGRGVAAGDWQRFDARARCRPPPATAFVPSSCSRCATCPATRHRNTSPTE